MSLIIIKQFLMYQKHAKEQLHKIIFSTLDDTIKKRTHYPMNSLFTQIRCRQREGAECVGILLKEQSSLKQKPKARLTRPSKTEPISPQ